MLLHKIGGIRDLRFSSKLSTRFSPILTKNMYKIVEDKWEFNLRLERTTYISIFGCHKHCIKNNFKIHCPNCKYQSAEFTLGFSLSNTTSWPFEPLCFGERNFFKLFGVNPVFFRYSSEFLTDSNAISICCC